MGPMMPPTAPHVAAQMAPPSAVAQYVGGLAGMPSPVDSFNPSEFALMRLAEAAQALDEVAKVLAIHKPAMLGILKVMVEAGSTLMSELQADVPVSQPAPGQNALPPAEAQPTTGVQSISMG